jgi:uncharacterized membrane protein YphA (DoxX/SURF4 family)
MNSPSIAVDRVFLSRSAAIASWALQILAALILGQTLFFKFTGAEEARFIFETLGVEPWGRYFTGALELVAVVLLLVPRTAVFGAALAVGLMFGAIASHLGPLGIQVLDDGGLLFGLALTTLIASLGVLLIRRRQIAQILKRLASKR